MCSIREDRIGGVMVVCKRLEDKMLLTSSLQRGNMGKHISIWRSVEAEGTCNPVGTNLHVDELIQEVAVLDVFPFLTQGFHPTPV